MPPSPISYPKNQRRGEDQRKRGMKPIYFLVLIASSLLVLAKSSDAGGGGGLMGGWKPIKNMGDPHVSEIGQFAVSEHNRLSNSKLGFNRAVRGETQVVNGVNYRLVIEAEDGDRVGSYEVIVWEKPWEKFRKLTSFKRII